MRQLERARKVEEGRQYGTAAHFSWRGQLRDIEKAYSSGFPALFRSVYEGKSGIGRAKIYSDYIAKG